MITRSAVMVGFHGRRPWVTRAAPSLGVTTSMPP
jgi:hypothetical protein